MFSKHPNRWLGDYEFVLIWVFGLDWFVMVLMALWRIVDPLRQHWWWAKSCTNLGGAGQKGTIFPGWDWGEQWTQGPDRSTWHFQLIVRLEKKMFPIILGNCYVLVGNFFNLGFVLWNLVNLVGLCAFEVSLGQFKMWGFHTSRRGCSDLSLSSTPRLWSSF